MFGTPENFEPVFVESKNQFAALSNHSIDVITKVTTHTLSRNVYEKDTQQPYTFSVPYFYDGLVFGGIPSFVECANNLGFTGSCRDLTICVVDASTLQTTVKELLPGSTLVKGKNYNDLRIYFEAGKCNVVAAGPVVLTGVVGIGGMNQSSTILGNNTFTREPLAVVTRQDDSGWSNLVNLIVNIFFIAEAKNISKLNAHLLGSSLQMLGDPELASRMEAVIFELGNYGDLYRENLESIVPRHGLNDLYDNEHASSGLLYYMPLGDVDMSGPAPSPNTTIARIQSRGYLRCGVNAHQDVPSATVRRALVDFDVEFCRAVAAALFTGKATEDTLTVIHFENTTTDIFTPLAQEEVDLMAGSRLTLQAEYRESITGQGYSFSAPYFYDSNGTAPNLGETVESRSAFALMTTERDPQWSVFVNFVVMGMLYAEDNGISKNTSSSMPIVAVFGEDLKQMLLDIVLAVGSYKEAYARTMAKVLPRGGANLLNEGLRSPQHYPIPFI